MRGRPPKPLEQKIAEGNPGKRALDRSGLVVPAGSPEPPDHLAGAEQMIWFEVLQVAPHIKRADSEILAMFCEWVVIRRQIVKQIRASAGDDGNLEVAVATQRGVATNPLLNHLAKATGLIGNLAAQLGLSPASRERLSREDAPGLFDAGWGSLDVLPETETTQ